MRSSFFQYDLPPERIAQWPAGRDGDRAEARLVHAVRRADGLQLAEHRFRELDTLLEPGDLLVLNDSRVLPSRFFITLDESGGSRAREIEVLLLREECAPGGEPRSALPGAEAVWEALARPMRLLVPGMTFALSRSLSAHVLGRTDDQRALRLKLAPASPATSIVSVLEEEGSMPIPPYIRHGRSVGEDAVLYQTVFARNPGSVAAPTAGLHFTPAVLSSLEAHGIDHCFVTLHVGPASFLPVTAEDFAEHPMTEERLKLSAESRERIVAARAAGRRIVAVGTTVVRLLETAALMGSLNPAGDSASLSTTTRLLIRPGHRFRAVDAVLTNFHQPRSTHLLLVAAFIGEAETTQIYRWALEREYRFLSYGDTMLLEHGRDLR